MIKNYQKLILINYKFIFENKQDFPQWFFSTSLILSIREKRLKTYCQFFVKNVFVIIKIISKFLFNSSSKNIYTWLNKNSQDYNIYSHQMKNFFTKLTFIKSIEKENQKIFIKNKCQVRGQTRTSFFLTNFKPNIVLETGVRIFI